MARHPYWTDELATTVLLALSHEEESFFNISSDYNTSTNYLYEGSYMSTLGRGDPGDLVGVYLRSGATYNFQSIGLYNTSLNIFDHSVWYQFKHIYIGAIAHQTSSNGIKTSWLTIIINGKGY